jgi:hypothetical protein
MANEITITAELRVAKGGAMDGLRFGPGVFTFTGSRLIHGAQSIGFAAEEALQLGEVTAGGWIFLRNLDATNFVSMRGATGQTPLVKMGPGQPAGPFVLHPSATAPTLQANVAACTVEYLVLEA